MLHISIVVNVYWNFQKLIYLKTYAHPVLLSNNLYFVLCNYFLIHCFLMFRETVAEILKSSLINKKSLFLEINKNKKRNIL